MLITKSLSLGLMVPLKSTNIYIGKNQISVCESHYLNISKTEIIFISYYPEPDLVLQYLN